MTNSRTKGRAAEQAAARFLTSAGWPTRRRLAGNGQAGDLIIEAAPHVVVDVKDRPVPRVYDWLAQLDAEAAGRRCQALLWKPWSKGPDPATWLAVVANHPLDFWDYEIARSTSLFVDLTTPSLRSVLGWLDVEADVTASGGPEAALHWCAGDEGEWLLMHVTTWASRILPCWEGLS